MNRVIWLWTALLLGAVGRAEAGSTTLDLGTAGNAASWLITGAGRRVPPPTRSISRRPGRLVLRKTPKWTESLFREGA